MYNILEILPNECIYNIICKLHPYHNISLSKTCSRLYSIINSEHYKTYIINKYTNNLRLKDLSKYYLMLLILYIHPIKESIYFYNKNIKELVYIGLECKCETDDLISIIDKYQDNLLYEGKINTFITSASYIVGKKRALNYNITRNILKYNRIDLSLHYWNITCEEKIIEMLKNGYSICEYMGYLENGGKIKSLLPYIINKDKDLVKYIIESYDIKSLYYYNPDILYIPSLREMKLGYEWGINVCHRLDDINMIENSLLVLSGYLLGVTKNFNIINDDKLFNIYKLSKKENSTNFLNHLCTKKYIREIKIYSMLDVDDIILYRNKYNRKLDIFSVHYNDIIISNKDYDKICVVMNKENIIPNYDHKIYGHWMNRMDFKNIMFKNIPQISLHYIIDSIDEYKI